MLRPRSIDFSSCCSDATRSRHRSLLASARTTKSVVEDGRATGVEIYDEKTKARRVIQATGEVLLSASEGWEFLDWGRQAHVGGGSHGSLHASDSLGALVLSGLEAPVPEPEQWAIRDVAELILRHFSVDPGG